MLIRFGAVLWLATSAFAQDTRATTTLPLRFDWPAEGTAVVTSTSTRGDRSFEVRYRLVVTRAAEAGERQVGRRDVRVTKWNGRAVGDQHRAAVRPTELEAEAAPDILVDREGACVGTEPLESWRTRTAKLLSDAVDAGHLTRDAKDAMLAGLEDPAHRQALIHRAVQPWDDWVGRWMTRAFSREDESFEGEIEIASGDVVDGTFTATIVEIEPAGSARLRLDFRADGARLDAAALKWRERLFGSSDEVFQVVELEVEETAEVLTDPATMRLEEASNVRVTRVTVGGDAREFRESQRWVFDWQ